LKRDKPRFLPICQTGLNEKATFILQSRTIRGLENGKKKMERRRPRPELEFLNNTVYGGIGTE
jgi:hypothetical protein